MQKRGLILLGLVIFSCFLALADDSPGSDISYSNDRLLYYYGLAVFKNDESFNPMPHYFSENIEPREGFRQPTDALVAPNEYTWAQYRNFGITRNGITLDIVADSTGDSGENGECTWLARPLLPYNEDSENNPPGCYVFGIDIDNSRQDDCAGGIFEAGVIIDRLLEYKLSEYKSNLIYPSQGDEEGHAEAKEYIFDTDSISTDPDLSLICAPRVFEGAGEEPKYAWLACNEDNLGKYVSTSEDYSSVSNPDLEESYQCSLIRIEGGGYYSWVKSGPQTCDTVECDANKAVCESENGNNWIGTDRNDDEVGVCCGDDGLDDLGLRVTDYEGRNRICLKKDPKLVGYHLGTDTRNSIFKNWPYSPDTTADEERDAESICGDNWCWVSSEKDQYNIYTIKKPGRKPVDVVSLVDEWLYCSEENVGPYIAGDLEEGERATLNHFYCYKEGDHWAWAECSTYPYPEGELHSYHSESIKGRFAGDGLYTLRLDGPLVEVYEGSNIKTLVLNSGDPYQFPKADDYLEYYLTEDSQNQYLFDFSGYNQLELSVRLKDRDGNILNVDNLGNPPELNLTIYGPEDENGENIRYLERSILGDVVNNPFLGPDNWIHLKVPIPDNLKGISTFFLELNPDAYQLEIKNVYLSNSDPGTPNPICSGRESGGSSSWLTSFDEGGDSDVIAEEMCIAHYGPNAWLGKDGEVDRDNPEANCCGDDDDEYYFGNSLTNAISGKKYGCWNSQPIASGDTIINVEFEAEWKENEFYLIPMSFDDVGWRLTYNNEDQAGYAFCSLGESYDIMKDKVPSGHCDETLPIRPPTLSLYTKEHFLDIEPTGVDEVKIYLMEDRFYDERGNEWLIPASGGDSPYVEIMAYNEGEFVEEKVLEYDEMECDEQLETHNRNYNYEGHTIYPFSRLCTSNSVVFEEDMLIDKIEVYVHSGEEGEGISRLYLIGLYYNTKKNLIVAESSADGISAEDTLISTLELPKNYFSFLNLEATNPENADSIILNFIDKGLSSSDNTKKVIELYARTEEVEVSEEIGYFEKDLSFPCDFSECLYPVPGIPGEGITIRNPHSNLYDLYYVENDEKETPITEESATFYTNGLIKAKRVPQQVLFLNDNEEQGFFGCEAATFLKEIEKAELEDLGYCSFKEIEGSESGGKFCSPSKRNPTDKEISDYYTTISAWSDESIEKIGYKRFGAENPEDISDFYERNLLELETLTGEVASPQIISPIERINLAKVLPAKNFLTNPEFNGVSGKLPGWEIFPYDPEYRYHDLINLDTETNTNVLTVPDGERLRSVRISIPSKDRLNLSYTGTSNGKIYLVDKEGNINDIINSFGFISGGSLVSTEFDTEENTFLIIEFSQGTVTHPFLQLVDEFGAVDYYEEKDNIDVEDQRERQGLACCPENFCWNGYTCVKPMEDDPLLAEHISEGRDYRCIAGEWKYLPPQWDWNVNRWGFCSQKEQCLVSLSGSQTVVDPEAAEGTRPFTTSDFYNDDFPVFPVCINDGEYLLDHYCEQGNWTTRTKYLAGQLLDHTEGKDFILYCAPYQEALLDYNAGFLGGDKSDTIENPNADVLGGGEQEITIPVCFEKFKSDDSGLVPPQDNTCINNVCLMQMEGKTIFATTLNLDLDDPKSFLNALNLDHDQIVNGDICDLAPVEEDEGEIKFVDCEIPEGSLFYSPTLKMIIYSKDNFGVNPGVIERIITTISNFFASLFRDEPIVVIREGLFEEAKNFNNLYVSYHNEKRINAIIEPLPKIGNIKQLIVAEYIGYTTPICSYLNIDKINTIPYDAHGEFDSELLELAGNYSKLDCQSGGPIQRVEGAAFKSGIDYLWPQLTSKLRIE